MPSATLTITLELEVDVSGTLTKDAGDLYPNVEDIEIEALSFGADTIKSTRAPDAFDNWRFIRDAILAQCSDQIADAILENRY